MVKKDNRQNISSSREIIKALLLQKAADKTISLRWDKYSLMFIYATLLIVLILILEDVDLTIVSIVAVLGLVCFWVMGSWQGKKLEKRFYEQERAYYEALFPDGNSENFDLIMTPKQVSPLTKREMEVMKRIVQGNTNKQIALAMDITDQTVKNHITNILKKLNVSDRTSAAVMALHQGWIAYNSDGQIEIKSVSEEPKDSEVQ
jgi:DNA-binding CsgD family transcriptional regulator